MSNSEPKKMLVTGGRGRLAALVADYFRPPAWQVELYSRNVGAGYADLARLNQAAILSGTNSLLHLAWSTLPATSERAGGAEWRDDLPALAKTLNALVALPAARRPHMVFFSSGGTVYGNAPGRPSVETDACRPIGWYGRAKRAAEELIEAAAAQHGLPCAILRISNPYGYPVPAERVQGVIPHAIRSAVEGTPLTLWGDGHARKDFLHHTDFLSALELVVGQRRCGTFNVCAGESHSVLEIIALVERHTGKKIRTMATGAPTWDVQDSRLDPGRFSALTGWKPRITLDEGIRLATADFLPPRHANG